MHVGGGNGRNVEYCEVSLDGAVLAQSLAEATAIRARDSERRTHDGATQPAAPSGADDAPRCAVAVLLQGDSDSDDEPAGGGRPPAPAAVPAWAPASKLDDAGGAAGAGPGPSLGGLAAGAAEGRNDAQGAEAAGAEGGGAEADGAACDNAAAAPRDEGAVGGDGGVARMGSGEAVGTLTEQAGNDGAAGGPRLDAPKGPGDAPVGGPPDAAGTPRSHSDRNDQ